MRSSRVRFAILLVFATSLWGQARIVSTAPAITETLFALGLGGRVVGVSTYCNYPAEVARLPQIGTYLKPNLEAIVRLRPDLVFVEKLPDPSKRQLEAAGIRVVPVDTGNVETNLRMMEVIAAGAGAADAGKQLTQRIRTDLEAVRKQSERVRTRKAVFIIGRTPGRLEGMIAVGRGSYLNELLEIAGGRNVFADSAVTYPRASLEAVVRLKPDVILDMGDMSETKGVTEAHRRSVEALWKSRKEVTGRAYAVADDIFVVPGPRMVDAARAFYRILHGAPTP